MFSSHIKVVGTLCLLIALQLPEKEVVRQCHNEYCAEISIQGDVVKFRENHNFVSPYDIGPYVPKAQRWVPQNEAPVREIITPNGWRAVVSASLDEYDEEGATLRLRIFDSQGQLQQKYDGNSFLDDIEAGKLFGTSDVVLSFQTSGASSSIQDTVIWVLPDVGKPREILDVKGGLVRFQPVGQGVNGLPGIWVKRVIYDGVHPETRGTKLEFWQWDAGKKLLTQIPVG